MFAPTDQQLAAIMAHAKECQPAECCGLIADGAYFPCDNKAAKYADPVLAPAFVMDEADYVRISKAHEIQVIVHSHVYLPPNPSDGDRACCEKLGLPWLIVNWPVGAWRVVEPCGWKAPLVGRGWAFGTLDCFGLVRDALKEYAGIEIPDFDRDYLWWKRGGDLISSQFQEAGFVRLPSDTPAQHLDVFGMQVPPSKVINHLALYLDEHGGTILHQMAGRLSEREIYGGVYQAMTQLHVRHRSLLRKAAA